MEWGSRKTVTGNPAYFSTAQRPVLIMIPAHIHNVSSVPTLVLQDPGLPVKGHGYSAHIIILPTAQEVGCGSTSKRIQLVNAFYLDQTNTGPFGGWKIIFIPNILKDCS